MTTAISNLPSIYDYIWIGLNEQSNGFLVTARSSATTYTGTMYVVGGVHMSHANTLMGAKTLAISLYNIRQAPTPYGIRVSEEAALYQDMIDNPDPIALPPVKEPTFEDSVEAYFAWMAVAHPGAYESIGL